MYMYIYIYIRYHMQVYINWEKKSAHTHCKTNGAHGIYNYACMGNVHDESGLLSSLSVGSRRVAGASVVVGGTVGGSDSTFSAPAVGVPLYSKSPLTSGIRAQTLLSRPCPGITPVESTTTPAASVSVMVSSTPILNSKVSFRQSTSFSPEASDEPSGKVYASTCSAPLSSKSLKLGGVSVNGGNGQARLCRAIY